MIRIDIISVLPQLIESPFNASIIKRAIEKYVIEMAEDIEDVIDAERVLVENNKSFSLEEVMKELNINIDSQDGNLEN